MRVTFLSYLPLVLTGLLISSGYLNGQIICGNDVVLEKQEQYLIEKQPLPLHSSASRSTTINIPVVVHLIYREEDQNLNDELIYRQIDILNSVFNNQEADFTVSLENQNYRVGKPRIRFCLAEKDPNGNSTTGIVRSETTIKNIGTVYADQNRIAAYYSHLGGQDIWNPDKYLNIWICEAGEILGRSTIPTEPHFEEEKGILLNTAFVSDQSLNGLGYTAVHEMGHYFGLFHLWGKNEGCVSDDLVEDTPKQEKAIYNCDKSVSCGSEDMNFNFMGYTPDICMRLFTEGQVDRMRKTIETYYPLYIQSSTACSKTEVEKNNFILKVKENTIYLQSKDNDYLSGKLCLYSVTGNSVYSTSLDREIVGAINTTLIPSGIYFLRFQGNGGSTLFTRKIFIR